MAKHRPSVRKNGRPVRFYYNLAAERYTVTIGGRRYQGQAATLADARAAVHALLEGQ